jgi:hypothetical protein
MEAVDWFQVWYHCLRDTDCFGMLDIKGRRAGDTEKGLCAGYDISSRYFHSDGGMQATTDEQVEKNFRRLCKANAKMQPWFRPISVNSDDPRGNVLEWKYPPDQTREGAANRSKSGGQFNGLESKISYMATTLGKYDGDRLRWWYLDEFGKIDPKKMDIKEQWRIVKLCLSLSNMRKIVGKALFTTTVEEIKGGDTITICREMWEDSDPHASASAGHDRRGAVYPIGRLPLAPGASGHAATPARRDRPARHARGARAPGRDG